MTAKKITTPSSTADKQNQSGISKETENKKSDLQINLNTVNVGDTMEFYFPGASASYVKQLKQDLNTLDAKDLAGVKVICFEYTPQAGDHMSDFKGIDTALEKLIENPNAKIILTSFMDPKAKELDTKRDKINLLLSKPNVKFIRLPFASKDLVSVFETKESTENNETNEEILKTITFKLGIEAEDINMEERFKEDLRKINLTGLKESMFVNMIAKYQEGQWLQNMNAIEVILNELVKNPDKKIIVYSPLDFSNMKKICEKQGKKDKLDLILSKPNVKFIEAYPIDTHELEHIFDGEQKKDESIDAEPAFQKIMEGEISQFLHDAKYWVAKEEMSNMIYENQLDYFFFQSKEEKSEKRLAFENKLIALLQMQHPSFKLLPRENNLQRIIDMYKYARMQTLPEGTRFEGIFVDRDGCLYDNKNLRFNQKIIDMIKSYESQGKKIILRTGGNLKMKQKLLDEAGLHYTIKNKTDYKGGTVEMAIDNDSPEFLLANAKIKAEQYIKI